MMKDILKKSVPHIIAIVVFIVVSVLFCKPVLEGNVLNQHDTIGWKGAAQSAFEYKKVHGHFPLWNPNVFSGMPNYQIAMEGKGVMPDMVKVLSLGLPKPINFFFLACLFFYILCLVMRLRPIVAILASLAYGFSTYNSVVIAAGHDTQMLATAYVPLLIAGLICTYEKKYWLGLALTTFASYQQVGMGHFQISYYAFIVAAIITLGYLYTWIKNKEWKHILVAGVITIASAIIGVAGNALTLKTTAEYTEFTMRGGKDVTIEADSVSAANTSGLDTAYAFEYSLGKAETFTLLMPKSFGGSSSETFDDKSKLFKKLTDKGVGENDAAQISSYFPKYWGALPYTAGPAYLGVFIFILGLLGFVLVRTPMRWALLAATLFGVLISWGKNLAGFNTFLFEHMPMYNKFRAPSMAQVIPQFTVVLMAAITLHQLLFRENSAELLKKEFRKVLYAIGGLFAVLAIIYIGNDYSSPMDEQFRNMANQITQNNPEFSDLIMNGIRDGRKALFGGQLLRALAFTALFLVALYLFIRNTIKPAVLAIILLVIGTLELTITSKKYLNDEAYVSPDSLASANFTPDANDRAILEDKDPHYRVFNNTSGTFAENRTSYFHRSIGGYHAAKLRIYQDVIEKYMYGRPNASILNMLDAKYIIVQDPQGKPAVLPNPEAFGPAWLVKHVTVVEDRASSLREIGNANLRDTAIVDKSFANKVVQPQLDSTATIKLLKFDSDTVDYEVNAVSPQFAVFSEIYYPKGWNAYIDGKKTDYVNANYILRGLSVPAGKHAIRFVFEPASYKSGHRIMFMSSIIILVILVGGLFMAWREPSRRQAFADRGDRKKGEPKTT